MDRLPTKFTRSWLQIQLKSKCLQIGQCHMQNAWPQTSGKLQTEYRDKETADRQKLSRRKHIAKPCYKANSIALPSDTFFDCLVSASGDGIKRRGREINWTYQTGCGILYSSFPIVFPSFPKWSMLISLNWVVTCGPDCTSAGSLLTAFVDIRETCRSQQ